MSGPKLPVYKPGQDNDPWRRTYDQKRLAGICVRSGCHALAVTDKSMCERHRQKANAYWLAKKAAV